MKRDSKVQQLKFSHAAQVLPDALGSHDPSIGSPRRVPWRGGRAGLLAGFSRQEPPSCILLQTQVNLQKSARNETATAQGVCVANLTAKDCEISLTYSSKGNECT